MQVDQRLRDCEPEACSADLLSLAALRPPETVEDVIELFLAQSGAIVGDGEFDLVAHSRRRELHLCALLRILVGVSQEVCEHLCDSVGVGLDVGDVLLDADPEALVPLLEVRTHLTADPLDQRAHRRRLGLDPELARVAAGEVEQVVDHLLELG